MRGVALAVMAFGCAQNQPSTDSFVDICQPPSSVEALYRGLSNPSNLVALDGSLYWTELDYLRHGNVQAIPAVDLWDMPSDAGHLTIADGTLYWISSSTGRV
jgi:hypothetical protein